jgi:hypothetical protein
LANPLPATDTEPKIKVNNTIGQVMQFYSAVFDQVDAGFITQEHVSSLLADFCRFVTRPAVQPWANDAMKEPAFGEEFRAALEDCMKGAKA